jgi:hypothetical protein
MKKDQKRAQKSLVISSETVRNLSALQLGRVGGGGTVPLPNSVRCPTGQVACQVD